MTTGPRFLKTKPKVQSCKGLNCNANWVHKILDNWEGIRPWNLQWGLWVYKGGDFGPLNSVEASATEPILPLLPEEIIFTLPGGTVMAYKGIWILSRTISTTSLCFQIYKYTQVSSGFGEGKTNKVWPVHRYDAYQITAFPDNDHIDLEIETTTWPPRASHTSESTSKEKGWVIDPDDQGRTN